MTVLHVDGGRGWRAGQRQALLLAKTLAAGGVACRIACPPGSPLAERAGEAGLDTLPWRPLGPLDALAAMRLVLLARRLGADVVHAHDPTSLAVASLAARLPRRWRLVGTCRDPVPSERWLRRVRPDRMIAVSRAVAARLGRAGGLADAVRVVPPGLEPRDEPEPAPWRARLGLLPGAIVVGSVGALTADRGYADLLVALAAVAHPGVHLVLVGGGPEAAALRRLARRTKLEGRLHLVGPIADARPAIAGFDVYVQPSRAEGFGLATLEALALGRPVVATTAGGLGELVEDGVSGILASPDDSESLAAALRRALGGAEPRARLAEGARRRAAAFQARAMADATLEVYGELVVGPAATGPDGVESAAGPGAAAGGDTPTGSGAAA